MADARDRLEEFGAACAHEPGQADDLAAMDGERRGTPAAVRADEARDLEPHGLRVERRAFADRRQVAADHQALDRAAVHRRPVERTGHASVAQHQRAVGDPQHLIEVVGDIDDRHAVAAELVDRGEQPLGLARAQAGGRFVEDEDPCARTQRLGDLHELPLRDGQAAAGGRWIQVEAHASEPARGLGAHRPRVEPAEAVVFTAQEDRTGQVQVLGEVQLLVHERDAGLFRIGHAAQGESVRAPLVIDRLERTRSGLQHAREDLEQRALAGTVLAHDREDLAGADLGIDAIERGDPGEASTDAARAQDRPDSLLARHGRTVPAAHGTPIPRRGACCAVPTVTAAVGSGSGSGALPGRNHFAALPAASFAFRSAQKASTLSFVIVRAGMFITPSLGIASSLPCVSACSSLMLS
ncbi:MAG: hypothetical protein RLZZ217_1304 [Planctomycetota bacterium]